MGWLVIVESRSKTFCTTCVLFWRCFARKIIQNIARATVQVIGINAVFSLGTKSSKCFDNHNMFAYFAPNTFKWSSRAFLFFKRCTFALTRMSLKLLTHLKRIIGTFFKTFPCYLSGVNSKCISDIIYLTFENAGW